MQFAAKGFGGASLRAIAGDAGVDASLISHYFGDKASLLVATMQLPVNPIEKIAAVVEGGTGTKAAVPGYTVGGKTGTARKPPYDTPPYRYVSSFVGFAPVENPRLAAIVVLDEPGKQFFGGTVAAPGFSRIMQQALAVATATFPGSITPELAAAADGAPPRRVERFYLASYHRPGRTYSLPAIATLAALPTWSDRRDLARTLVRHRRSRRAE